MTASETTQRRASAAVTSMLAMLDEETLAGIIDRPADDVLKQFRFRWYGPVTVRTFHQVLGQLVGAIVRHLSCAEGPPVPAWSSRDAAVDLLRLGYQGVHDNGYDGALLELLHPSDPLTPEGIDGVLIQLAGIIKARLRDLYAQSVYGRYLDPCDPDLRQAIASEIQHRHRDLLPPELLQAKPYELVGEIPHLLTTIINVRQLAQHLTADPLDSAN